MRASQSLWPLLGREAEERIVARLRDDLESGAWDRAHGHLRAQTENQGALRLVISKR